MREYMDLGIHTVPLKGKLERVADGSGDKTIPKFEKDWRKHYTETFNEKETALGGIITGECSKVVAVDCDSEATWQLFRALDPDYKHVLHSKGKGYTAGTMIYKYDEALDKTFSVNDDTMRLDFYSNDGFIYLATKANKTKIPMPSPLPEIREMPQAIKILLIQLAKKKVQSLAAPATSKQYSALAPLLMLFQASPKKHVRTVLKILTPTSFRELEEYRENGYIYPEDIPDGRGSEYLSKISAILGADRSVDEELYANVMTKINRMFAKPMEGTRLSKTIMDPMLTHNTKINGEVVWQFDPDWEEARLLMTAKRGYTVELSYDEDRGAFCIVNESEESCKTFFREQDYFSRLRMSCINPLSKGELQTLMPNVPLVSLPADPFGYSFTDAGERVLNTFQQTPALKVLSDPESYKEEYSEPTRTLQYFKSLVPDEDMRDYLIRFIKTKLTTFHYSPVVLFFMGVHGSGKDVFVSLLEEIMGSISRPSVGEFMDKFNHWMTDVYFAQLDEYGNQLQYKDRDAALGLLKAYTGKQSVQIRQMRTDGFQYRHNITFIMTQNKNPLLLEDGDRRIAFFNTPNVLTEQKWVRELGGAAEAVDHVKAELLDFCYYLATEVEALPPSQYMKPRESADKAQLIYDSQPMSIKIASSIKTRDVEALCELALVAERLDIADAIRETPERICLSALKEIYEDLVDSPTPTAMHKALTQMDVPMTRTTTNGRADYCVDAAPIEQE